MATVFGNDRLSTRNRSRSSFGISPFSMNKSSPGRMLFCTFVTVALALAGVIIGLLFKYNFWANKAQLIQYDEKQYNSVNVYELSKSVNFGFIKNRSNSEWGSLLKQKISDARLPATSENKGTTDGNNEVLPQSASITKSKNESECQFSGDFSNFGQITQMNRIKIWPMPDSIALYEHEVPIVLPMDFQTNCDHEILHAGVKRYYDLIFSHTLGDKPRTYSEFFDGVVLHVDNEKDDELGLNTDESYELLVPAHNPNSVNCNKVLIRAPNVFGILRGLETLSQLIRYDFATDTYKIGLATIKDKPKFAHRGILLDTSRHFHPPAVVKHLLDAMSYAKFNVFHWHVVDEESFPYQSNAFPNLWNGSYSIYERYSENDILEIIEYARFRGIRVIPEFDTPGHAGSWCKGYPDICIRASCRKPSPTLLDPSNPLTFEIVEGVIKEASHRFPDHFLHLGMDEVRFECYDGDAKVREWLKTVHLSQGHDIYRWWADKATAISLKYKKRPIVWQEVYKNFETKVPKETVIHLWMGKNLLRSAAMNGYDVLVSHGWYLDHLQKGWKDYYTNNLFDGIEHESEHYKKRILGGEACMWSEHIDLSVLDATVWPKAAAAAENLWSTTTNVDYAFDRLEHFRCLLIRRGVGGGPLKHVASREAPDSPHSCFQE